MPNKVSRTEQLRLAGALSEGKGVNQESWAKPFAGRGKRARTTQKLSLFLLAFALPAGNTSATR